MPSMKAPTKWSVRKAHEGVLGDEAIEGMAIMSISRGPLKDSDYVKLPLSVYDQYTPCIGLPQFLVRK
jgi:hypothetical protein